jgi:flavocytochrome c
MGKTTRESDMPRRNFLKTAAAVGAGASALGALTVNPAGAQVPQKWDKEADVLIIGSGYAGLCAAIEAAQTGASVLVVEKEKYFGGNSLLSGGHCQIGASHVQKKAGIEDYPEWMYEDMLAWGKHRNVPELVRTFVENGPALALWLEELGIKWSERVQQNPDGRVPRGHWPAPNPGVYAGGFPKFCGISLFTVMYNRALKLGVNFLGNCKMTRLVREKPDQGRVLGIEAAMSAGEKVAFQGKRAVLLASGGFKSNPQMRMAWDSRLDTDLAAGGLPYVNTTGEGIAAALDIGAGVTDMSFVCELRVRWGTPQYQVWEPQTLDNVPVTPGVGVGNAQRVIIVANDGERICNEVVLSRYPETEFFDAFLNLRQRPRNIWAITDTRGAEKLAWSRSVFENPDPTKMPFLRSGHTAVAGSLAELAQKMGIPAANLEATVKRYNALSNSTKDPEFGRPAPFFPLTTPPFLAAKGTVLAHDQMGGLRINTKGQVLQRQFQLSGGGVSIDKEPVIPNFYAAGECTGGVVGEERGHGKISVYMVYGRIAGKHAATEKSST